MGAEAVNLSSNPQILPFEYSAETDAAADRLGGWSELTFDAVGSAASATRQDTEPMCDADLEGWSDKMNPAALHRSFEAGWQKGIEEGRRAERALEKEERVNEEQRRKEQIRKTVQEFASSRDAFLLDMEHEVVELALGIAGRILRREAQMDPLLLSTAVRVALGQLGHTTEVRMRVPASDASLWQEVFAHAPNLKVQPEVIAVEGMSTGDCQMETRLGSVDLGLCAQLAEIEKGFFDRRQQRPTANMPKASTSTENEINCLP